jgi:predicted nucleic acid-binding protein
MVQRIFLLQTMKFKKWLTKSDTVANDTFLFALSKETNANFILTGDKHLLKLQRYNNTVIMSYSEFMKYRYKQEHL